MEKVQWLSCLTRKTGGVITLRPFPSSISAMKCTFSLRMLIHFAQHFSVTRTVLLYSMNVPVATMYVNLPKPEP